MSGANILCFYLLSFYCVGVLTVEFVSVCCGCQGSAPTIPSQCKGEALRPKRRTRRPSFMVGFTVKVFIGVDTSLKCGAKLKLDTRVRPRGFKEPAWKTKTGSGQQTDVTICFLHNAQMRSGRTFFPHEAHVFGGGGCLLFHSETATGMESKFILAHVEC